MGIDPVEAERVGSRAAAWFARLAAQNRQREAAGLPPLAAPVWGGLKDEPEDDAP
jgi:hypothetical protein